MDIGGGEEVRKYPHMCSSSLGAKGGGAVIRNGGGEGGSLGVLHYALSLVQTLLARTYQFGAPVLLRNIWSCYGHQTAAGGSSYRYKCL